MAHFYCIAYMGCFMLGLFIGGVACFIDGKTATKRKKEKNNGSKEYNSKMRKA